MIPKINEKAAIDLDLMSSHDCVHMEAEGHQGLY